MAYTVCNDGVIEWATGYNGERFHAVLCDPPYHLTSIVKRFGKPDSAPAQYGVDGAFARATRGFMGKEWDGGDVAFRPETWAAIGDCLLPGAYLMAFGGDRTHHRTMVALEDAGFIIRTCIYWVFGSGFPKSRNIEKAILSEYPADALCACDRRCSQTTQDFQSDYQECHHSCGEQLLREEGISQDAFPLQGDAHAHSHDGLDMDGQDTEQTNTYPDANSAHPSIAGSFPRAERQSIDFQLSDSIRFDTQTNTLRGLDQEQHKTVSDKSDKCDSGGGSASYSCGKCNSNMAYCQVCGKLMPDVFHGYGTALKPAAEIVIVAQKPIEGTYAENCVEYGAGAMWIEGCRISTLTWQRPSDTMTSQTGGQLWENELYLCKVCADIVENNLKSVQLARKECSVVGAVNQIRSARGEKSLQDMSRRDTGCSDGTMAENTNINLNIGEYGNLHTEKYQMDMLSTTATGTKRITESRICCLCGEETIPENMFGSIAHAQKSLLPERDNKESAALGGRWPSNFIHDGSDEVVGMFPQTKSGGANGNRKNGPYSSDRTWSVSNTPGANVIGGMPSSEGSAARFFYAAKASNSEREMGLIGHIPCHVCGGIDTQTHRGQIDNEKCHRCIHPTVKPIALTEYLAKLILPPKEYSPRRLLVPFSGSGSEMIGAHLAGWDDITGIEMDAEYCEIAEARLRYWTSGPRQLKLGEGK